MFGPVFIYGALAVCCWMGLARPHWALLGYYGFSTLVPTWNWRWSLPQDAGFQKYLAISCLLGFLLTGLRGQKLTGAAKVAVGCLAGYLGLSYLSALQSVGPADSWWFLSYMWKIVVMAAVGVVVVDRPAKLWALVWVILLAQGYNAFRINEEYFRTGVAYYAVRGWGHSDNNIYSLLTMPAAGCALGVLVAAPKTWQRAVAGGVFVLQMHQVMLLASRGAMLGGLVMCGFCFLVMPKTKWTVLAAVGAFTAGSLLAGPSVMEEFSSSFKQGEELDSSADSRFKLWEAGAGITADYPLLGAGPNAGRRLVPKYYPGGLGTSNKSLHNIVFDITTGSGVPAAVLYYTFFAAPWLALLREWYRGRRTLPPVLKAGALAYLCGWVGYFVSGQFATSPLVETPYGLGVIGCVTLLLIRRHRRDARRAAANDDQAAADQAAADGAEDEEGETRGGREGRTTPSAAGPVAGASA